MLDPRLNLQVNPFEPAGAGAPSVGEIVPPGDVAEKLRRRLGQQRQTLGSQVTVIVGEYGSGKTCCLRWIERSLLPEMNVQSFYFQDPGVQFYDLADSWLRNIGRKNLAKTLWELCRGKVEGYQGDMFESGYQAYAARVRTPRDAQPLIRRLQEAFRATGVTEDEEIAKCLAQMVAETPIQPHFEYRDFIPRGRHTLVPERHEPSYFQALIYALWKATQPTAIAFLIDEFEEIGLHDTTRKRTAQHYLTTLKRLVDLASTGPAPFWVVLTMTPEAYRQTQQIATGLADRMGETPHIELTGQTEEQAERMMLERLAQARPDESDSLFPFRAVQDFSSFVVSSPRRLVQTCSLAISSADSKTEIPFTESYVRTIQDRLYPKAESARGSAQ